LGRKTDCIGKLGHNSPLFTGTLAVKLWDKTN